MRETLMMNVTMLLILDCILAIWWESAIGAVDERGVRRTVRLKFGLLFDEPLALLE